MKLLVVIVNYKVTELTIECLRSLSDEMANLPDARVVVCENGTGADAARALRQAIASEGWGDWARLVTVHPNRGFTGGNNVVLRPALASDDPPEYLLLLNADTIVRPNALANLLRFMDEHRDVGIAGSRLEDPDGTPQVSAFRFHTILSEFNRGLRLGIVSKLLSRWVVAMPIPEQPMAVPWVSGASMMIRREVMQRIGVLDEDYYTYFDDIDYCFNAAKAGWSTWYVPESRVVHLGGQTTGIDRRDEKPRRRPEYWFQARRHYFLKNHGRFYAALADAAYLLGFSLWRFRRLFQRKPDADPPNLLRDALAQSVFATGFRLRPVENPAMRG